MCENLKHVITVNYLIAHFKIMLNTNNYWKYLAHQKRTHYTQSCIMGKEIH